MGDVLHARQLSDQQNIAFCTARVASIIARQLQNLEVKLELLYRR